MRDTERCAADQVELEGTLLVEASAGTGKTWTIGALVLRFLLEQGLTLPELLVLTFTDAATAELRDRLRARLEEARRQLEEFPDSALGDVFLDQLRARLLAEGRWSPARALGQVRQALASFDEASIFTIHGFCRRVLAERPLALGLPPRLEAGENADLSLQETARDELRRLWDRLDPGFLDWLAGLGSPGLLAPEAWIELARLADRHPDALIPPPPMEDQEACAAAIRPRAAAHHTARERVRGLLDDATRADVAEACARSGLNAVSYASARVAADLAAIQSWLRLGAPVGACAAAGKYTPSHFAQPRVVRKGEQPPRHPLFDDLERLVVEEEALIAAYGGQLSLLQVLALRDWPGQARRLRLEQRRLDFGDLLTRVRDGLAGVGGEDLATQLRRRWRVALVDEYQDTDPVQADIFRRVFGQAGLPLVLVGDPKQSIYGFRGADLHAYLAVARRADRRVSLGVNWRSDPGLVGAVNLLFDMRRFPSGRGPFLHSEILPQDVEPNRRVAERRLLLDGRELADLWVLQAAGPELGKGRAQRLVCGSLAHLAARLLRPAAAGRTGWLKASTGEFTPVQGRDIAVLVRTHAQAEAVAAALADAGVACAQVCDASVWDSREAQELVRLLTALARPHDTGAVRALLTGIFALALELSPRAALLSTAALEHLQQALHTAAAQARLTGLAGALEGLTAGLALPEALLGLRHGERRLVNWRHLLDLLRLEEAHAPVGPAEMALRIQLRRGSRLQAENAVLRLESEENLVRVVTQHRCKGLEFPLVFCPFLWTTAGREQAFGAQLLHDDAGGARLRPYGPHHPLDGAEQAERQDELLAEDLRLAYVGLTRARSHTVVHSLMTGPRSFKRPAALHWLLLAQQVRGGLAVGAREAWKELLKEGNTRLHAAWDELAGRSGGAIAVGELEAVPVEAAAAPSAEEDDTAGLSPRAFTGSIPSGPRISSFTSLMTGAHGDERLDEWFGREDPVEEEAEAPVDGTTAGGDWKSRFPRGARAGLCLHDLLERVDFQERDPAALQGSCRALLQAHGLEAELAPRTAAWLLEVLDAPLEGGTFRLRDLAPAEHASELEFHLAVAGLEGARLEALLRRHRLLDPQRLQAGGPEAALLEQSLRQVGRGLPAGWLKGYIDLCHVRDGRWWVVDWKSNRLGPHATAYTRPAMLAEMARSGYFLQALLYLTALHRHLGRTQEGYDPERHLGGLRYFFLRGIDPAAPGCGVFEDRPPLALVTELDRQLGGEA